MTWHVTYRLPAIEGGAEITVPLGGDWCELHGVQPADLTSGEHAAWACAMVLCRNGQDDAELLAVEDTLPDVPGQDEPEDG